MEVLVESLTVGQGGAESQTQVVACPLDYYRELPPQNVVSNIMPHSVTFRIKYGGEHSL